MSEYPVSTALVSVRNIKSSSGRVLHFVPLQINDGIKTFVWSPHQEVTLVNTSMYTAPLGPGGHFRTWMDVRLPDGQVLQVFDLFQGEATSITDLNKFQKIGITFPIDTEFTYNFSTLNSDDTDYWSWLNFQTPESVPISAPPAGRCGFLERALGVGGCDY